MRIARGQHEESKGRALQCCVVLRTKNKAPSVTQIFSFPFRWTIQLRAIRCRWGWWCWLVRESGDGGDGGGGGGASADTDSFVICMRTYFPKWGD
jgi:hypothetical protein